MSTPCKVVIVGDKLDLAEELRDEFHAEAKAAVGEAAGLLLGDVKRRLRLRRGTPRTAAPSGEPPEYDTGDLERAFRKIAPRIRGNVAQSGIQARHPGASRLEYGFTDTRGIRTFPHPYIRPAMVDMDGPIGDLLRERLS